MADAVSATSRETEMSRYEVSNAKSSVAGTVELSGRKIDMAAARALMDDDLCEQIHGTVDSEQEFLDAYLAAHQAKYGSHFVFA